LLFRNYNETEIGKFIPPNPDGRMLDPMMRRSTEFPKWVDDNKHLFEGKKVTELPIN
jgi:predicted sulfurtransferase